MSKVELTVITNPQYVINTSADIEVQDYGSLVIFRGLNSAGQEWLDDKLEFEPWQETLGGVAVDFRYSQELMECAVMDGLAVSAPMQWKLPRVWRFDEEVKR